MHPDDEYDEDAERSARVRRTLITVVLVLVALGAVVAIGTTLMVRSLGLSEEGDGGAVGQPSPRAPLPTTALPVPGQQSDGPEDQPSELVSPSPTKNGDLQLSVTPLDARPGQRINLTGTYQGQDNVQLEVQRFQDGAWSNFGVDATVRVGTYATYIITGRTGEQRFRMFDTAAGKGSNVVLVKVG